MENDVCTPILTPRLTKRRTRHYVYSVFILALVVAIAYWMDYRFRGEMGVAQKFIDLVADRWGTGALIAGGVLYIVLLSLPFIPGVELGVLLMCVFGKEGIAFVYVATVLGLNLSFFMGRMLPGNWIKARLKKFGILDGVEYRSPAIGGTLHNITTNKNICQKGFFSFLSKHRYLAIGILYNIPGNYLIGGGGGISLACGLSGILLWRWFFLTVVLSVAPVPLFVWFGVIQLESFLGIK
jgi:uncharacterized membrane protein YdjX (TVP38/TMEM64 family)